MLLRLIFSAAAALTLAGCIGGVAPKTVGEAPGIQLLDTAELPAPLGQDKPDGAAAYRIGPYDRLVVDVFGVADYVREAQVDGAGSIVLPLIGRVQAGGLTPFELSERIAAGLSERYIRDPQVTVNLKETVSQVVTVDGEVREPGLYPVLGTMTLMRAVARAKGTSEFAKIDDVVVFRTVGEDQYVALYNLGAIRRGNYADPKIYAGDIVIVGDSPGRRRFQSFIAISSLISAPLVALANRF